MVRETRHLWVGNLPDNIREDRIREHFKRYGRVQSVKILARGSSKDSLNDHHSSPGGSSSGGSTVGTTNNSGGTNNNIGCGNQSSTGSGGITSQSGGLACTVAFMDIKSASKAHTAEHKLDDRTLTTEYYEPTAIISAATQQSGCYSTSPVTQRFPNSHGTNEDHSSFGDRFYERTTSTRVTTDPEYLRRPGYHESPRGRARDRLYRGNTGPYAPLIDRRATTSWSQIYDTTTSSSTVGGVVGSTVNSSRYSSSNNQNSLGSVIVQEPSSNSYLETSSTRGGSSVLESSLISSSSIPKKLNKIKSRSGSESPSGSLSSRSPSRSRSTSPSTSSATCTSSRASSSPACSPQNSIQPRGGIVRTNCVSSTVPTSSTTVQPPPPLLPTHSEDRRPLAICVRNLPARSSDTSLKDGLFHEYKKHGKVTWVKVVGQSSDRYALVCFKKPDDVEKALEVSYDKLFFGCKIEVAPYQGYDVDDNECRPYEAELDEYHPKATRTLFVGNLEKDITTTELRKHFEQFGDIIEVDIKKQGANNISSYAFCQYSDICSVVKAIRTMDGEHLGNNRIKLGFGKSMPTNCVWLDIGTSEPQISDKYLTSQFHQFGTIQQVIINRDLGHALIFYDQIQSAQSAVKERRGFLLRGRKLQIDFASRECQDAFFEHLEQKTSSSHQNSTSSSTERVLNNCSSNSLDRQNSSSSVYENSNSAVSSVTSSRVVFDGNNGTNVVTNSSRFRYETSSTRPRTSSYSRSSSVTTSSQCPSAVIPSPSTASSRVRLSTSRYTTNDYYESGTEYSTTERPSFRSYDEFSQGSTEDLYDHETPTIQSVVIAAEPTSSSGVTQTSSTMPSFPPPDIRHLQKERVHLLEQLEECPSSGDEHISPKKRLKLDLHDSNLLNNDTELLSNHKNDVRRLSSDQPSQTSRHCSLNSRRPSTDNSTRPLVNNYMPHAICKRRKTASSGHHHHNASDHHTITTTTAHSGSESIDGSRPGTPLCDERPENINIVPCEPRRFRERTNDGPLSLPLPKFAAQFRCGFNKSTTLSSTAITSPPVSVSVIATPLPPPSPVHVPPPASPPPRPPSLSSNSSDSDAAPASPSLPSLDERIKSVVEKYEKWSGSRSLSTTGSDTLAKIDASISEKFRFRHKLLDVDLKEVPPSEIVKSVLAKRSVFDEDSKRLENFGEKYEPKEFVTRSTSSSALTTSTTTNSTLMIPSIGSAPTTIPIITTTVSSSVVNSPSVVSGGSVVTSLKTLPGTSPKLPPAKGLQYPFPSHPPAIPLTPTTPGTPGTPGMLPQTPISSASITCTVIPPPVATSASSTCSGSVINSASGSVGPVSTTVTPSVSRKTSTSSSSVSAINSSELRTNKTVVPNRTLSSTLSTSNVTPKTNKFSDSEFNKNIPHSTNTPTILQPSEVITATTTISSISSTSSTSTPVTSVLTPSVSSSVALTVLTTSTSITNHSDLVNHKTKVNTSSGATSTSVGLNNSSPSSATSPRDSVTTSSSRATVTNTTSTSSSRQRDRRSSDSKKHIETNNKDSDIECDRLKKDSDICDKLIEEVVEQRGRKDEHRKRREESKDLEDDSSKFNHVDIITNSNSKKASHDDRKKDHITSNHIGYDDHKISRHHHRDSNCEKVDKTHEITLSSTSSTSSNSSSSSRSKDVERTNHDRRNEMKTNSSSGNEVIPNDVTTTASTTIPTTTTTSSSSKAQNRHHHHNNIDDVRHKDSNTNNNSNNNNTISKKEKEKDNKEKEITKTNISDRQSSTESRHLSIDSDKSTSNHRHLSIDSDKSTTSSKDKQKERTKERNNSSPSSIGLKRRFSSSQDNIQAVEDNDAKRLKTTQSEHKKVGNDRRDSKDSTRSSGVTGSDRSQKHSSSNKHQTKNNFTKMLEDKIREEKRSKETSSEPTKERNDIKRDKLEKQRSSDSSSSKHGKVKNKVKENSNRESPTTPKSTSSTKELSAMDKEFLNRLELKSTSTTNVENEEKQRRKEKRNSTPNEQHHPITPSQPTTPSSEQHHRKNSIDESAKISVDEVKKQSTSPSTTRSEKYEQHRKGSRDESSSTPKTPDSEQQRRAAKKEERRLRKINTNSSDTTDSDEPKKHSIFDIEVEPAYISMYDKVKARSCKNMQKQEEEKRQEKIKAKFSQLKQSRAKREEKKRSTSWDEDSDSDQLQEQHQSGSGSQKQSSSSSSHRRGNKLMITSSSEDETQQSQENQSEHYHRNKKHSKKYSDSDNSSRNMENNKHHRHHQDNTSDDDDFSTNRVKLSISSRKGSKSRIHSDTSDCDVKVNKVKLEQFSDNEMEHHLREPGEEDIKCIKKEEPEEDIKYIKKENKRLSLESSEDEMVNCVKQEPEVENHKYDYHHRLSLLCDASSEGETTMLHQEKNSTKSESRKKHKKKQKRQKNSSSENEQQINTSSMTISTSQQDSKESKDAIRENHIDEMPRHHHHTIEDGEDKRKKHNKKEKKRDKLKVEERSSKDKIKKSKKSIKIDGVKSSDMTTITAASIKRDEKMQDIFGPFSDDSENGGQKDFTSVTSPPPSVENTEKPVVNSYYNSTSSTTNVVESGHHHHHNKLSVSNIYGSDTDSISNIEKTMPNAVEEDIDKQARVDTKRDKEESLRKQQRKEKKRKEKEQKRTAAAIVREENENSVDLAEAGRALEAKLLDDSIDDEDVTEQPEDDKNLTQEDEKKIECNHIEDQQPPATSGDVFRFTDGDESQEPRNEIKKEVKEKKKKRKKSKEEKHKKEHHHHHRHYENHHRGDSEHKEVEKVDTSLTIKHEPEEESSVKEELSIDTNFVDEIKQEIIESPTRVNEDIHEDGLPNLLDVSSPKSSDNKLLSPPPRPPSIVESLISPIPKTPSKSSEKKKFIPGFGVDIDETIHENAIKSISTEFVDSIPNEPIINSVANHEDDLKTSSVDEDVKKVDETTVEDNKPPRVVISQEETEDAVAALLGESFGGDQNEFDTFDDVQSPRHLHESEIVEEEHRVPPEDDEDDEEMRQAVQSLSTTDVNTEEAKPDTPLSEHELQIDTDTDNEEVVTSTVTTTTVALTTTTPCSTTVTVTSTYSPKTPEMVDYSQPPKTPDVAPTYLLNDTKESTTIPSSEATLVPPPPLLVKTEKQIVPENIQQPSVISKPWILEQPTTPSNKPTVPTLQPNIIKFNDTSSIVVTSIQTSVIATQKPIITNVTRVVGYAVATTQPQLLSPIKISDGKSSSVTPSAVFVTKEQSPIRVTQSITSPKPTIVQQPTLNLLTTVNRLPITPVLAPISKSVPSVVSIPPQTIPANLPKLVPVATTTTTSSDLQHTSQPQQIRTIYTQNQSLHFGTVAYPSAQTIRFMTQKVTTSPAVVATARFTPTSIDGKTIVTTIPTTSLPPTLVQTKSLPAESKSVIESSVKKIEPSNVILPVSSTPSPKIDDSIPRDIITTIKSQTPVTTTNLSVVTANVTPTVPTVEKPTENVNETPSGTPSSPVIVAPKEKVPTPPPKIVTPPKVEEILAVESKSSEIKLSAIEIAAKELNMQLKKEKEEEELVKLEKDQQQPLIINELKQDILTAKLETDIKSSLTDTFNEDQDTFKTETSAPISTETVSVIKEIDIPRYDDDKTEDTESGISDMSKENMRLSADILENKDDPLDSKEDSDYWSAKEVNIESVIKTIDASCSADELSEGSEVGKEDWYENENKSTESDIKSDKSLSTCGDNLDKHDTNTFQEDYQTKFNSEPEHENDLDNESEQYDEGIDNCTVNDERETSGRISRRGGRMRGRKSQATKSVDRGTIQQQQLGVQTRRAGRKEVSSLPPRGSTTSVTRGITTRGTVQTRGVTKPERKIKRDENDILSSDVYEFRDESDESKNHPRLIMTIKSSCGNITNTTPTVVVKETPQSALSVQSPNKMKNNQEFISPSPNTRKSARLQERDISKNSVDDTIEDVVRNMVTRSGLQINPDNSPRRTTRQNVGKGTGPTVQNIIITTEVKKVGTGVGGRGKKGVKDRRASDAGTTDDSSEETKSIKKDEEPKLEISKPQIVVQNKIVTPNAVNVKPTEEEKPVVPQPVQQRQDIPPIALGRKAAMLGRVQVEQNEEPQTLIDPVTGHLMIMKESGEGQYVTISTISNSSALVTSVTQTIAAVSTPPTVVVSTQAMTISSPLVRGAVLPTKPPQIIVQPKEVVQQPIIHQNTVITSQQQQIITSTPQVIHSKPPQSLKAHVLSSQAAKTAISQLQSFQSPLNQSQPIQKQPTIVQQQVNPVIIPSQSPGIGSLGVGPQQPPQQFTIKTKSLNVNVSLSNTPTGAGAATLNLSPRMNIDQHNIQQQKIPPMSPAGIQNPSNKKQHLLQAVNKQPQQQQPIINSQPQPTQQQQPIISMLPSPMLSIFVMDQQPQQQQQPRQSQGLTVSSPSAPIQLVKSSHVVMQQNQLMNAPPQSPAAVVMGNVAGTTLQGKPILMGQSPPLSLPAAKPPHGLHPQHPQQIMTGAVASPPLKQHMMAQQPIVTGASSGRILVPSPGVLKGAIDASKLDPASLSAAGGCVLVAHPSASPQARGQALQPDMPIAAYDNASLHGVPDRSTAFSRSRQPSPPPAHQQMSPAPQGETLAHLVPPHPYMPSHVYQQYLRTQPRPYQLSRSPHISSGLEKPGLDGQEGEEAPVTSPPPLELRRPASGGQTPFGRPPSAAGLRTTVVPHGLQSPHGIQSSLDRATDSPQVAPVYMTSNRMLHYGSAPGIGARTYYEPGPGEPPPAHRVHSAGPPPLSGVAAHAGTANYLNCSPSIIGLPTPQSVFVRHQTDPETFHRTIHLQTPPHHIGQVDSLYARLKDYPILWQGLLALKNDTAAVQMYYVFGNRKVAEDSLPVNADGSTPPLRIAQRMRLDKVQIDGVARKLGEEKEHCMLVALPCGKDTDDVVKQSNNLTSGFIKYLQEKQAAGIVNIAAPGTSQQAAFVIHMFPSCGFANDYLQRTAPQLFSRVNNFAHLIIIIATV